MKKIIDFTKEQIGTIAREGELNRTQLVFSLDEDLQMCDFINVVFGINDNCEEDNPVLENLKPDEGGTTLTVSLSQDMTVSGALSMQLVGYVIDSETAEPQIIAKSPTVSGVVTPSLKGLKKISGSEASLLDRIWAKVHELIEKAHDHANISILNGFDRISRTDPLYGGIDANDLKHNGASLRFASEGAVVKRVAEVEKDGAMYFRLFLNWGNETQYTERQDYIDIPVSAINSSTDTEGGLTLNGAELDFGLDEISSGGIPSVTALPETANEGDVVYYCPPANTLTAADSGHKAYINMAELERALAYLSSSSVDENNYLSIWLCYNELGNHILILMEPGWLAIGNYDSSGNGYTLIWFDEGDGVVKFFPEGSAFTTDTDCFFLPYPVVLSFNIGTVNEDYMADQSSYENNGMPEFPLLYVLPRFYRYTNGAWVEMPYTEPELPTAVDCTLTNTSLTYGILPNILYRFGEVDALSLAFLDGEADKLNEYKFSFVSGETATVLTLPSDVVWANELTVEANKRYEISVVDNVALWCAVDYTAEVTE